ncbi:response regulator transcription factor [Erwinia sp. S38]|uniref:helix-turn-helix transcriptional regulator n=1 Tax=Erwinia sp. S38 TaxID=2769338 RepID=UPI00190D0AE5|nr:response regulator transcription factor [Erwinia sp. S38]MBK0002035.1 response regulator transcription factor [Erwinia sp. S38]
MKRNHLTVVINDLNRFFAEGLMNCISDNSSSMGLNVEFTDCVFNSRAKLIFLSADTVSVANLHYLNRRLASRALSVFIIHDATSNNTASTLKISKLNQYTSLYRDQAVDDFAKAIRNYLEPQSDLRNILIPPCSVRSKNNLTRRETEILRYLARGISNGAVARFLHISEKTVSAHKRNIMSKLNMIRPAELNYWLLQEGWCESWRSREK